MLFVELMNNTKRSEINIALKITFPSKKPIKKYKNPPRKEDDWTDYIYVKVVVYRTRLLQSTYKIEFLM